MTDKLTSLPEGEASRTNSLLLDNIPPTSVPCITLLDAVQLASSNYVAHVSGVFMEKTWKIKSADNLHTNFIMNLQEKYHSL